jgi:hypothetical protein
MRSLPILALLLLGQDASQLPPIGIVDFYGLRTVPPDAVQKLLPFHEGDTLPASDDAITLEIKETEEKLKALPNVADAHVEMGCCEQGHSTIYIGIQERNTPAPHFLEAPQGAAQLPAEILAAGKEFEEAWTRAIENGHAAENDSHGYALAEDPACQKIQKRFLVFAARYRSRLRDVLQHSSDAEQRALAAQVLSYSRDQPAVIPELLRAMRDPASLVRNSAMRALWILAMYAQVHPHAHFRIPPDDFVAMLNSVDWTDRNKASLALAALTEHRNPALLAQLREQALPSLVEMARWKSAGHANAPFFILGRVAGLPEAEIIEKWEHGSREDVIAAALKPGAIGAAPRLRNQ